MMSSFKSAFAAVLLFATVFAQALELPVYINDLSRTLVLEENTKYTQDATRHYSGKVKGIDDSWVRISHMPDHTWSGMVSINGEMFFIDAASATEHSPVSSLSVDDVAEHSPDCGTDHHGQVLETTELRTRAHKALLVSDELAANFSAQCVNVDDICVYADLELVFDQEYQTLFASNLLGTTASLVNMLEGYYLNQFNIAFNVINQVYLTDATDLYSNTTNPSTLLADIFSRRCEQVHGAASCAVSFPSNYDNLNTGPSNFVIEQKSIVHLVTGRDFDGTTAGIAFTNTFCNTAVTVGTTNVSNPGSPNLPFTAAIMAHEIGHNFGSKHDSDDNACPASGFVMAAILGSLPGSFSSCSEEVITQNMADHMNDSCATAPLDVAITRTGTAPSSPTVGDTVTLNNVFVISNQKVGFRNTGSTEVVIRALEATFTSATLGSQACTVNGDQSRVTCPLNVNTALAAQNFNADITITGENVRLIPDVSTTTLFKDTNVTNDGDAFSFTASPASTTPDPEPVPVQPGTIGHLGLLLLATLSYLRRRTR